MSEEQIQNELFRREHERRLSDVEQDMKVIKPIVYNTSNSVNRIDDSVKEMKDTSKQIKMYVVSSVIVGIVGIVFMILQNSLLGGS